MGRAEKSGFAVGRVKSLCDDTATVGEVLTLLF